MLLSLLGACASTQLTTPEEQTPTRPNEESEGARLYRQHCASCHRPLDRTAKQGRSASRIHSAIRHFQAMRSLDLLSIDEIRSIAEALASSQAGR